MVRVVFQGVRGAYSEAAVHELLVSPHVEAVGLPTFEACFQAVASGEADYAMLPMENTMGGSVIDNFDLQLRFSLHAVAELNKRVVHCLMALPGQSKADIQIVASHPQALAQCAQYIRRELPHATVKPESDTAGTAEKIRNENLRGWAALASSMAAKTYGLEILAENVQDVKNNVTRFLLYARQPAVRNMDLKFVYKASVVFTTGNRAGALYHAIEPFARRNVSMTKLESRPDRRSSGAVALGGSGGGAAPSASTAASPTTSTRARVRDPGALELVYGPGYLSDIQAIMEEDDDDDDDGGVADAAADLVDDPLSDQDMTKFRAMFFMDIRLSEGAREAVRELALYSPFFRVLGVYAAGGPLLGHVAQALGVPEGTNFAQRVLVRPPTAPPHLESGSEAHAHGHAHGHAQGQAQAPSLSSTPAAGEPQASPSKRARPSPLERAPSALSKRKLVIAVVGFGNFGQFLSKTFIAHGHTIRAWSRSDHSAKAKELGVHTFPDVAQALQGADVVLLSTSILSFESVLKSIDPALFKGKLVVDVLSVKTHAKRLLLAKLGQMADVDILCTHPMFGPESGKHSWRGLYFVFERVRVNADAERCEAFLQVFRTAGCVMVEMTCEEHDEKSANSQFVTHFTGRSLNELGLSSTGIDTRGFASLLALVENTCKDSDDLFLALYRHNPNAKKTLDALRRAVDGVAHRLRLTEDTPEEALLRLSDAVDRVAPSKTVKTHALAMELKAKGKDVVTTLTVGEPNFGPPEEALKAAEACLRSANGTKYTAVGGTPELKRAIAADYASRKGVKYDPNSEILVSCGGKQSVYQMIHATCGPGDEVVIPAPYWVSYPDIARLAGATPIIVRRTAESGYKLSPEQLRAALTPRTRVFILCNPCNPTGSMYTRAELEGLARVLADFPRVLVMSDEIYERIVYDGAEHVSFAALPGMRERTVMVNGVAKGFAMTGMRIGWMCGPSAVVKASEKLQGQITSCACSVSQAAAAAALPLHPSVAGPGPANLGALDRNRRVALELLQAIPGVSAVMGGGAFYYFVRVQDKPAGLTGERLCEALIRRDKGVAFVPGEAFGDLPEDCSFRISYAASEADVREGIQRFRDGLMELRKAGGA